MKYPDKNNVTAVVLAGGRGSRLGGQDKGLLSLDGKPLISQIIDAIKQQSNKVIINANRNQPSYAKYGYPVIDDELSDYQGPLAGIAAVLSACETDYIITLPCDGPSVPADLVQRLIQALADNKDAELAVAHDGQHIQPMYALIPRTLLASLIAFLDAGDRQTKRWYAQQNMALADFSDIADTFFNINTEDDKSAAEKQEMLTS